MYHKGKGQPLNHIVASISMQECIRTAKVARYYTLAGLSSSLRIEGNKVGRLSDHGQVPVKASDAGED